MFQNTEKPDLPEIEGTQKDTKRNTIEAADEQKGIILQTLARYPVLSSIVPRKSLLYRVAFDQYDGEIPPERFKEIAERSLGGILLYSVDKAKGYPFLPDPPQHRLNFLPLPHGHFSFLPTFLPFLPVSGCASVSDISTLFNGFLYSAGYLPFPRKTLKSTYLICPSVHVRSRVIHVSNRV